MTVPIINKSVEKTNIWLGELADELGIQDRQQAYRVLRAYMHALRDRLPVDEVAQLAAQLPELIRGIYYEGWNPGAGVSGRRDLDGFLERLASEAKLDGETEASYAASSVARVLRRHVSAGELADVRAALPEKLKVILG